ncbi:O-antigen/teichoic acid export membrane protein [Flavobacterium sp. AG291]|nr:O-antigen/teichoic acid export membrane protein [Flavobacterium sp. AG291]
MIIAAYICYWLISHPSLLKSKTLHKQVVYFAIINYLGTAIGIISALFIYPRDFAFSGTIKFVDNMAQMLYPIMVLGASHALIKFYPELNDEKRKQLFNYSMLSVATVSVLVLLGIFIFNTVADYKDAMLIYFAFPVGLSLAYIDLFRKQAQDLQRLAVPTLFEKIIPKVVLPLLFLLVIKNIAGVNESLFIYAISFVLIGVFIGVYLFRHFKPGFNYRFKTLFGEISRKDYFKYSLFSFTASLGSLLAFRIDGIIIYNWISEEANGIFSNGATLASTLQIPAVGMFALYAPLISNYLKDGNLTELNVKYKEVARLLFFIGAVLYSCIVLGIDDLFSLLPTGPALKQTTPIIYILGFSVLINMATGFNTEIITYSKYYRFNMIAICCLIFVNIGLNIFFLSCTELGIIGVAYASFISVTLFNILKLLFLYKKFGLLPFDVKFAKMMLLFALSGVLVYILPDSEYHLLNLVYKTGLSLLINVIAVYKLRLVYQVNVTIDKALNKLFRK